MYRKYTSEEKLNIVEGYLNVLFSLEEKAHKLGYEAAPGCFKRWVRQYQEQGAEGFLCSAGNKSYTAEFKTIVVEEYFLEKAPQLTLLQNTKLVQQLFCYIGFRCIMPIESLRIIILRGRSIWQKRGEKHLWKNEKKLSNTALPMIEITKKQLLCMMFHTARFIPE